MSAAAAEGRVISPRLQRNSVIAAGFGQNLILTTVTTFLMLYLVQYARISTAGIATVTAILAAARVFDAFADPLVGGLVDSTRSRSGKMRPYILFSALPVAVLTTMLFAVPQTAEGTQLLYFGICYFLWGLAYAACDVPYWGLIGAAFTDVPERNRVISKVRAFGGISLGLATLGMPWLAKLLSASAGQTTAHGWTLAVALISFLGMGLFLLAFFNTRERSPIDAPRVGVRNLVVSLVRNTPLMLVLLGSVLGFGRMIVQAGGAVFVVVAYGDEGVFTLVGAAIIGGMVLASLFAPALIAAIGGRNLMLWSTAAAVVIYVAMFLVGFKALWAVVFFVFLSGLTLGVFTVVQTTMIADAVDWAERRTGVRNDGISFSMLTFIGKIMSALAVLVFGVFVVVAGYQAGTSVTPQMQQTLWVAITLIPALSCLLSLVPFWFYRLPASGTRAHNRT